MLSRMDHCDSYDDVEAMDTSLAKEMLAKSDIIGVVLSPNVSPCVFVQVAEDNNDISEETLDRKRTTHATTLVLYQRGQFGPAPSRGSSQTKQRGNGHFNPLVCANLSDSRMHTESGKSWKTQANLAQMH